MPSKYFSQAILLVSAIGMAGCAMQPMHQAALDGDEATVRALLATGVDVDEKVDVRYNFGPVTEPLPPYAANQPRSGGGILVSPYSLYIPGNIITWESHYRLSRNLSEYFRSPLPREFFSYTPLQLAIEHGHRSTINLLLARGADVNAVTEGGKTPLHIACYNGLVDVVQTLIDRGADINAVMRNGMTPLHMSAVALENNLALLKLLLEKGADVNVGYNRVGTPLLLAAALGRPEIAEFLLGHGAQVNGKSGTGYSPIHVAAALEHKEFLEVLLRHGVDVDLPGEYQMTPLHLAAQYGHLEMVQILLDHGASVLAKDFEGKTPLIFAENYGHAAVAQLLRDAVQVQYKKLSRSDE